MNTTNPIILTAAVLTVLLSSCGREDVTRKTELAMHVVPMLAEPKAGIRTTDLKEFYLQINSPDPVYSYFECMTKDGSGLWVATSSLLWKNETAPVTYSAAYYNGHKFSAADFANGVDLAIPSDQSTLAKLNEADLLSLPATNITYATSTRGELPVELYHGLAQVNFRLTFAESYYDKGIGLTSNPITDFAVSGAVTGFNFKPLTGLVTPDLSTKEEIIPLEKAYTPGTPSDKAAKVSYEAILLPQTFAPGKLDASFDIGVSHLKWANSSSITLEPGKTYTINIIVQ